MRTGPDCIHEQMKAIGIKLVASLPDNWLTPTLERIDRDPEMTHVRVARESEAVGVCAGAFFGGAPTCAIMGIAGLLTCGHEFALFNQAHQVPLFIIASLRGTLDDLRTYQVAQGLYGLSYLDSLEIPYMIVDKIEDLSLMTKSYRHCRLLKRPSVFFCTKEILSYGLGKAGE